MNHRRVVSLVPSATESLLDLGLTPVACTRFCEQPTLPHIGGTKDPDLAAILQLRPDLVVMCEEENLLAHHDELVAAGLQTFTFHINSVADVEPQLIALAQLLELDLAVLSPFEKLLFELRVEAPGRISAFVPIWRRPLMTLAGATYGSSLLASLGVTNVFAAAATRYPEVTPAQVLAARPDVVLAPTEPYPFAERHLAELASDADAPAVLVDGQDLFWWGTRTPAARARLGVALAELLSLNGN